MLRAFLCWMTIGLTFEYFYFGEAPLGQLSTWVIAFWWFPIFIWMILSWVLWAIFIGCIIYMLLAFVAHFLPALGLSKSFFQLPRR